MTTTAELTRSGLSYTVLVSQDITPADRADLDRRGLPYAVSVASNVTPAALTDLDRRGLTYLVSVAAGITPAGKTALNQRGLPYAVLVPASSSAALLASLEQEGLQYLVEVDSSGNSVDGAPAAPVNTGLPAITGTPTVGQTLTASTGTWTGSPTPTYAYQWKNAGVNIGGATASTYLLQASDEGDLITVTVTATNASGSASATSASVGPIAAAAGAAPALSAMTAVDFSDIFVWGQATTDTGSGTLYAVVVPQADATPTAIQITESKNAAGTVITQSGNVAISSTGVKQLLIRNLTAVTAYKVCVAHLASGNYSNVVTANFTTDTLVASFATVGTAGSLTGNGTAPFLTNVADPTGGTGAVGWEDNGDTITATCTCSCGTTFFNGVNKVHLSVKWIDGAAWMRLSTVNISVTLTPTHFNTSTGALGTSGANWTPTPTIFDLSPTGGSAAGWWMFSGQGNVAGADVVGGLLLSKANVDNTNTVTRNGSTMHLYNIRVTRV